MGQRLPRANWQTTKLTNANLSNYALAIVNGLTAAIAIYPTPPVLPAALQTILNNYNTALAASIGGSKLERKTMAMWRENLRAAIRQDGQYVNQISWNNITQGQTYDAASEDIVSSGYQLGIDPSPVGPLPEAVIKKWSSPKIGQLHALVIKIPGARAYLVQYGSEGTDPDTWTNVTFPSTRINIFNLTSATSISFIVSGVGSSPVRNFSAIKTQVIS